MSDGEEAIAIGAARLWRDLGPGVKQSDASASWFRVLNMPKDLEADLFWVTGKQWAFIVRGKGTSHMSAETYSSKESALEELKAWLREKGVVMAAAAANPGCERHETRLNAQPKQP